MRTSQKGFTLVELIVVITILAILGTIAFISLQGYSQDAKNSKVTSDLRTLASAVETSLTNGSANLASLVASPESDHEVSGTFGSLSFSTGSTGTPPTPILNPATITVGDNYNVGKISYVGLRQNSADFVDPEGYEYLIGYAAEGNVGYYQLAGQIKLNSGNYEAVVTGNYVKEGDTDVEGLISPAGSTNEVVRGQPLGAAGLGAPKRQQ